LSAIKGWPALGIDQQASFKGKIRGWASMEKNHSRIFSDAMPSGILWAILKTNEFSEGQATSPIDLQKSITLP